MLALARSPSAGVPVVLARGRVLTAFLFVVAATCVSALVAVRLSSETNIDQLFLPETRHPVITAMLITLGTERTAVLIYLAQRSFDAVVAATAVTPFFVWILGSTAVHASARLAHVRRPFVPILVLFGYAAGLTLVPATGATLVFGVGSETGAQLEGTRVRPAAYPNRTRIGTKGRRTCARRAEACTAVEPRIHTKKGVTAVAATTASNERCAR